MGTWLPRNMLRIEINIHEKLFVELVICKDHTKMHGEQNKFNKLFFLLTTILWALLQVFDT